MLVLTQAVADSIAAISIANATATAVHRFPAALNPRQQRLMAWAARVLCVTTPIMPSSEHAYTLMLL